MNSDKLLDSIEINEELITHLKQKFNVMPNQEDSNDKLRWKAAQVGVISYLERLRELQIDYFEEKTNRMRR